MQKSYLAGCSSALAALILGTTSPAASAATPSFDCSKPASEAEGMVCKDDQLSALDVETARLFKLARDGAQMTEDSRKELVAVQRGFIKGRDDCWKADDKRACIADNYVIRIYELRKDYADARSEDAKGISLGPFAVTCGGADGAMAVTFVNVDPSMAYLAWGDNSLVMTLGQSGSGARYAANAGGKETVFWNKGDEASLSVPGQPDRQCKLASPPG